MLELRSGNVIFTNICYIVTRESLQVRFMCVIPEEVVVLDLWFKEQTVVMVERVRL